jgi:fructokinase
MIREPDCLIAACEILWDCFPDENRLGGATFNVAYHLDQLGLRPGIISSVGKDPLGDEALRVIEEDWSCDTRWIRRLDDFPTGRVDVTLDANGEASYDILTPAAWDYVEILTLDLAGLTCPLVYPSVGLRGEFNREQLRLTLGAYPGLKCFDVNLRPPHNPVETVLEFASLADFVKLNEDELTDLAAMAAPGCTGLEPLIHELACALGVDLLCVTRAERPAAMLCEGKVHFGDTFSVTVKDTVGAGDAFFAAMLASLNRDRFDPVTALSGASALGSWVAAKHGAQPLYDGTEPTHGNSDRLTRW